MQVGSVEVPGSRAFQIGFLITFGIVALAGIVTALPLPVVGLILFVGWGIGFVAGALGGAYTARSGGVESGSDGAMVGGLVGGLGNLAGAVVGTVALAVVALAQGEQSIPSQTPGGSPTTVGEGQLLLGVLIIAGIGIVTGTVTALIGGAIGGFVGSRL